MSRHMMHPIGFVLRAIMPDFVFVSLDPRANDHLSMIMQLGPQFVGVWLGNITHEKRNAHGFYFLFASATNHEEVSL